MSSCEVSVGRAKALFPHIGLFPTREGQSGRQSFANYPITLEQFLCIMGSFSFKLQAIVYI